MSDSDSDSALLSSDSDSEDESGVLERPEDVESVTSETEKKEDLDIAVNTFGEPGIGIDVERVLSIDMGHVNWSYGFYDVRAEPKTKKADREKVRLPPLNRKTKAQIDLESNLLYVPTDQEMMRETPLNFHMLGTEILLRPLHWKRIDLTAVNTGEAVVMTEGESTTSLSSVTIHTTLMYLKGNGHLDALKEAIHKWRPTMVIFEQQFGPTARSQGNPRMFALSNALWLWFIDTFPEFMRRPPAQQGPSASMATCDMIQKNPTWAAMGVPTMFKPTKQELMSMALARSARYKRKRKHPPKAKLDPKFKKRQVVHVVKHLVQGYNMCYRSLVEIAADKGDDIADILIQVVSFWRKNRGPQLKKDKKAGVVSRMNTKIRIPGLDNRLLGDKQQEDNEEDSSGEDDGVIVGNKKEREEFDTIMKKGKKGKTGKRRRLDDDRSEDMENGIVVYILGTDTEVPKTPEEIAILSKGRWRPKFPKTYVGYTNDIRARLEKHRTGKGALDTSWTSDWRVIAIVRGFASMPHARHFEHVIHYMSGAGDRVKEPFTLIKKHRGASHQVRQLTVALSRPDAKGLRLDWHWDKSSSKGQLPSVLQERSVQKSTEPKS